MSAPRRLGDTIGASFFASYTKLLCFIPAAALILIHDYKKIVGLRPLYEDDAYYYFIIARNIVEHGRSTFDGQVLTNGYHPLWLAVLVVQYALTGVFGLYPNLIELACVLGGLVFLLAGSRTRDLPDNLFLATTYTFAVLSNTLNGMEASLTVFCLCALIYAIEHSDMRQERAIAATALIGAVCIAARIDSAMFVVPLLYLSWPSWRARTIGFGIICGLGSIYVAFNLALFQMALPVSGTIKSLGGLQINHALLNNIPSYWSYHSLYTGLRDLWENTTPDVGGHYLLGVWLAAMILYAVTRTPRIRRLLAAFLIGMTLYLAKLLFYSSWPIWPWYYFPLVLGIYACSRAILALVERSHLKQKRAIKLAMVGALALGLVMPTRQLVKSQSPFFGFDEMAKLALQNYGGVLNGARVAMGDRSGGFAINYDGPVTQLEGLVEDREYLETLQGKEDLRALLCRRGVHFIVDYEEDLGAYATHRIDILPQTAYPAPDILVTKADEIGRVSDARFDQSLPEKDRYIYIWRLSGCGA